MSDEFHAGIWWIPNGYGDHLKVASKTECAAEIQRLREQLATAIDAEKSTRGANVWLVDTNRQLTDALATARVDALKWSVRWLRAQASTFKETAQKLDRDHAKEIDIQKCKWASASYNAIADHFERHDRYIHRPTQTDKEQ